MPKLKNEPFDKETQDKAYELINTGRRFKEGGFWKNRTRTADLLKYGDWDSVPQKIKDCVNQIGRGAKARHAKKIKKEAPMRESDALFDFLKLHLSDRVSELQEALHPEDEQHLVLVLETN